MKDWLRLFLVTFSSISLSSCIEFEQQEIQYRHDVSADELRMILKYEGIFGGKGGGFLHDEDAEEPHDPKELTAQQIEQLESVLKGGRAFFFSNWIFEYDSSSLSEILDKFQNGELRHIPLGKPEQKLLLAALRDIELSTLGLYLGPKDRLCGTQTLVVKRLSDFLGTANEVIRRQVGHGIEQQRAKVEAGKSQPEDAPSQETIALLEKACGKRHDFLIIKEGRLVARVPLGKPEYLEFKREVLDKGSLPKEVTASYGDNLLAIVVGREQEGIVRLKKDCFNGYRDNALRYLRKKHPKLLREQAAIKTEAEQFLSGGD